MRFTIGYGILVIAVLGSMIVTIAVAKGQIPKLRSPHKDAQVACVSVGCAQLGDDVTYVLHGQVTQVSSPQAGVICVQVQSRKMGGDYCALAH